MNTDEKNRFEKMEKSVETIEQNVGKIMTALLGNDLSGDEGFKGQIRVLKEELEDVKTDIKTLREERVENKVYVLIIKALLAIFAASLIGLLIK